MVARRNAAILLAIVSIGCQRRSTPPVYAIDRIELPEAALASSPALNMSTEELRRSLVKALEDSKRFAPLAPGSKLHDERERLHCRLAIAFTREVQEAPETGTQAEVGVRLELRRARQMDRYVTTGLGRQSFAVGKTGERAPAFRKALERALEQAVQGQVLQLASLEKSEGQLIQDLAAVDPRVREYAATALGERKSAAAVLALIERLRDSDREVALRSVGALGAIGDPRAVPALIDMGQGQDPQFVLSLVDVIGSIGGKDAEGYLFTLASGHTDDAVRAAAQEAQERLKERAVAPQGAQRATEPARRRN